MEDTLVQAAAEGIGVYFSSGDNGDETSRFGFATTEWPASSPWVTSVGGTSLAVTYANTRVLETDWGTSNYNCNTTTLACARTGWLYGADGVVSQIFAEPWYQVDAGLNLGAAAYWMWRRWATRRRACSSARRIASRLSPIRQRLAGLTAAPSDPNCWRPGGRHRG